MRAKPGRILKFEKPRPKARKTPFPKRVRVHGISMSFSEYRTRILNKNGFLDSATQIRNFFSDFSAMVKNPLGGRHSLEGMQSNVDDLLRRCTLEIQEAGRAVRFGWIEQKVFD